MPTLTADALRDFRFQERDDDVHVMLSPMQRAIVREHAELTGEQVIALIEDEAAIEYPDAEPVHAFTDAELDYARRRQLVTPAQERLLRVRGRIPADAAPVRSRGMHGRQIHARPLSSVGMCKRRRGTTTGLHGPPDGRPERPDDEPPLARLLRALARLLRRP